MCDDCQVGVDLTAVPIPEEPGPDSQTEERRAWLLNQIKEEGHPSLIDNKRMARMYDVSLRQTYYDIEAVMDYVEEHIIAQHHTGKNWTVFEKAKREALREGDWKGAVDIVEKEADWLEKRGHIEKETDDMSIDHTHEVDEESREAALETIRQLQQDEANE